ncbi:DNA/RNA nuclease SfsA [Bacteriovoracaceae bacterium]|nr:DNA/RNA nuclease SfsA [Bacteriovoracaceae bacterium]
MPAMNFDPPLVRAKILKRYKRFLADVQLENGDMMTVHVPNTGAMTSCWEPNWECALSKSDNSKRKYAYTLEMTHNFKTWIAVNTSLTNRLVEEFIEDQIIEELKGYRNCDREQFSPIGESKFDFFLSGHDSSGDCYLEVKNVTLLGNEGEALFPDAVSTRAMKHVNELTELAQMGFRSVLLFLVQREDVEFFSPAISIYPEYAAALWDAEECGVEVLAYQTKISPKGIHLGEKLSLRY